MRLVLIVVAFAACIFGAAMPSTHFPLNHTSSDVRQVDDNVNSAVVERGQNLPRAATPFSPNLTQTSGILVAHKQEANNNSLSSGLDPRSEINIFALTDKLLFIDSLEDFLIDRQAKYPSELIWYSNGCSNSPDNPLGFKFKPTCYRHDFGYSNYVKQGRFDGAGKRRIDLNFYRDMKEVCDKLGWFPRLACRGVAFVYFHAVQLFGRPDKVPAGKGR